MTGAPRPPRYEDVHGFGALLAAFGRARRRKRGKGGEPAFYRHLEAELLALSQALRDRTYQVDPYRYFVVRHTKERVVAEATFRDRVVHHSLVAALEPAFEARFIPFSYACRKGRGTHRAIARARRLARRHPYFLRMDVASYFATIPHDVVLALVGEIVDDEGILWLCAQILAGARAAAAPADGRWRGLPIGNLTSQFWANVVLDPIDQRVFRALGETTYTRYMDDTLVLGPDKAGLWELAEEIGGLLGGLGLQAKARATAVAPVTEGIPWLGMQIFPHLVRLQPEGRRRFGRKLAASLARAGASAAAEAGEVARAASLCGHLEHADARALRRSILARLDRV